MEVDRCKIGGYTLLRNHKVLPEQNLVMSCSLYVGKYGLLCYLLKGTSTSFIVLILFTLALAVPKRKHRIKWLTAAWGLSGRLVGASSVTVSGEAAVLSGKQLSIGYRLEPEHSAWGCTLALASFLICFSWTTSPQITTQKLHINYKSLAISLCWSHQLL